jgi:PQQ-like domain
VSPDGMSVFVTGVQTTGVTFYDYVTIAYDASTGDQRWLQVYDGSGEADSWDVAYALDVSPDGSAVVVTGLSAHADGVPGDDELTYDIATVSYDATTGAPNWAARFNSANDGRDYGQDVEVSPDGGKVFVSGKSGWHNSGVYSDATTIAYDAQTGGKLWSQLYDGPANSEDMANYVAVSSDGGTVAVTGNSIGNGGVYDIATIAYDAVTGAPAWSQRFDGPQGGDDDDAAMMFGPDGATVYVLGTTHGMSGYQDFVTLAYDAATGSRVGKRLWDSPCGYIDRAGDLAVAPGGRRVYVTGIRVCDGKPPKWATVAYTA